MGAQSEWEEPRSIWEDEVEEGDEIAIFRAPIMDDTPIPERVKDLPKRREAKSLSQRIEEMDSDVDENEDWISDSPKRKNSNGEAALKALEVSKIVLSFILVGGVMVGLGWALWWVAQQYGVI